MKKPELFLLGIDGGMPSYIRKGVEQGKLPSFEKLMKKGTFFTDMMPAFPSITPTCWAAISCGAVASVTGALCADVHVEGTHPTQYITPYNGDNIKAERFWEAAARVGKTSLILDVPTSGPAKSDKVMQVKGGIKYKNGAVSIPNQHFNSDGKPFVADAVKTLAGGSYDEVMGKTDFKFNDGKVYGFKSVGDYTSQIEEHEWWIIRDEKGVRVGLSEEDALLRPVLLKGCWTDVITRRFKTSSGDVVPFHFRAKLEKFNEETGEFSVFVTGASNLYREITPLSLAKEIAEIPEINQIDHGAIALYEADRYFETLEFCTRFNQLVMKHCVEHHSPDIIFDYEGAMDSLNHSYWSSVESTDFERYEGQQADAIKYYERAYKILDDHLAWIFENIVDENTTIAITSDHGAVGYIPQTVLQPWEILVKEGLLYSEDGNSNIIWTAPIDWTKSKAYPVGSCYVNVNLKGREPTGIVEPEDYEKVKHEIIEALFKNAKHDKSFRNVLAFAIDGNQAGFMGHGGENCGDVVYGIAGSEIGGFYGGIHAHQVPSARTKMGDIRCIGMICGPKFKENAIIERPADLTDIAPTLCFALGYPQPKDATGGVIFTAYKDE